MAGESLRDPGAVRSITDPLAHLKISLNRFCSVHSPSNPFASQTRLEGGGRGSKSPEEGGGKGERPETSTHQALKGRAGNSAQPYGRA